MKCWERVSSMGKLVGRIPMVFGLVGGLLGTAWGVSSDESEVAAAKQAIEQAPDPSAAVAAYANGVAVDAMIQKSPRPTCSAWSISACRNWPFIRRKR